MELLTILLEAISTVGFPIVCVIALGIFIWKIYKASEAREENLREELRISHETNEKAIETIAKFADNLDIMKNDIGEIKADVAILKVKGGV